MIKKLKGWALVIWILIVLVGYWIMLPPINPSSIAFWAFFLPVFFVPLFVVTQVFSLKEGFKKGKALWPVYLVIGCIAVYLLGSLLFSPVINARHYTNRITITTADFEKNFNEVDFNNLPLLDKASSQKVGDRVVGQAADLVSQFSVSDEYSLINYRNEIVRVTPLEHNGFFKYLGNLRGTAGYVIVDCTTGDARLVRTQEGLKYLPSAYMLNDLTRHVRFHYPFENLGETSFEIDENGVPYWIIQTISYTWVNLRPQVSGIIAVNAMNGQCHKYKVSEVPQWIDNVYDASLVISEIDSWGLYQNGYLNSIFAQKNVVQTTDGYTYITADDDVFMYTGITSVSNDESNIGFVLVNLRTHQADYFEIPGAEEFSAMDSAVGAVQEKNYISTFPLLIKLQGRPTYLVSLKDGAGLVKMYGFIDVSNYQKVTVTDSSLGIVNAANEYLKTYHADVVVDEYFEDIMTVVTVSQAVVNGNTTYFITDQNYNRYQLDINVDLSVTPFIGVNDTYKVKYYENGSLRVIVEIGAYYGE
ncbi:MAG: hypothetical protein K6A14_05150 [Erysipelotrichaceae bacterium]|nr:hypothetical protein [Erysipelotrichaceae bacterium]